MFGLIKPCRHSLAHDVARTYHAHMCGICLSLRNQFGQIARSTLHTDTLTLTLLAEHLSAPGRRSQAGRCALRGMRTAVVLDPASRPARYAAAVCVMLVDISVRDHLEDRDQGRLSARIAAPMSARYAGTARRIAAGLGVDLSPIDAHITEERLVRLTPGRALDDYLEHTAQAFAIAFAGVAIVVGVPGASAVLANLGRAYGATAAVVDALEDDAADAKAGRFNLLSAAWPNEDEPARHRHANLAIQGYRSQIQDALTQLNVQRSDLLWSMLVTSLGSRARTAVGRAGYGTEPVQAPGVGIVARVAARPASVRPAPPGKASARTPSLGLGLCGAATLAPIAFCDEGCDDECCSACCQESGSVCCDGGPCGGGDNKRKTQESTDPPPTMRPLTDLRPL